MKVVLLLLPLSLCYATDSPDPPCIRLNSSILPNRTDLVLEVGSVFNLSCHGNLSVRWTTTSFTWLYKEEVPNPIQVNNVTPRHTGTYICRYTNQSLKHLHTWVHLYAKEPGKPSSVFQTLRKSVFDVREGEDFLFMCLLTDPSLTNLTLKSEDSSGPRWRGLPLGMNVTFDPRRGALIREVQRSFRGRYYCSGRRGGVDVRSRTMDLEVVPKLRYPPSLSVSQQVSVRLKGEEFEVTCRSSNPSHFITLTWTPPHSEPLNVSVNQHFNHQLFISSTLTLSPVRLTHSGTYTCTAVNEAGAASVQTLLTVLDAPYLRIYLQPLKQANTKTNYLEFNEDSAVNVSSMLMREQEELEAGNRELIANVSSNIMEVNESSSANTSGSSMLEVYGGQDVMLTFVMEAYPPVRSHHWTTTTLSNINNNNTWYKRSYGANGYRSEASLLLRRVCPEDGGQYSFHFENSFFNGSQNIDLQIYRSPSVSVSQENGSLTCSSSGYPLPTILWFTCPGLQDSCGDVSANQESAAAATSQEEEVRLTLGIPADDVTAECVAYNKVGVSRQALHLHSAAVLFSPALIGSMSCAAVLLLLLFVVSYKWRQKPRYEVRWKIIESSDGNNYTFFDPAQLPYNRKWEFPRDHLRLGAVLGSGAFGKVVEATAYGLGSESITRVAVKMLKPSAHSEEREALMSELKILGHLGYHYNIVNLLGACTQGGPMLMITEYCSHGDLLNFLRAHARDFMDSVLSVDEASGEAFYKNTAGQSGRLRSDSGISCCSEYQEMLTPGQKLTGVQTDRVSVSDLIRFSYQVSQGLDFLSSRNCIHRDVAARNVLLTDRRVAKICDFGLARDIRNDDSYIVQGNARLPVKWMSPESIFGCIYTVQSDVWSYGVFLWETFSLGKSPYPNIAVDTNFYKMIQDGRHMEQPDFAPAEMYQLMTRCWSLEPTDRPTFKIIGQLINRLLPPSNETSPHHSEKSMYRNINECREEEEEEENGEEVRLKRGEEEEEEEEEDF